MRQAAFATCLLLLLGGCGRGGDRQEDIPGMIALGAAANPLVATPSVAGQTAKTVEITFVAAIPLNQTATLAAFVDTGSTEGAYRIPAEGIQVDSGPGEYVVHKTLQIYSQKVLITLPTQDVLSALSKQPFAGAQVTYGLTLASAGATQNVIANFNVFPTGSTQLAWANPTIKITAPVSAAAVATNTSVPITAQITDATSESNKVGWYVSQGDVTNRRAANTSWNVKDAGAQTLVVTLHGVNTRGFAYDVIDVQSN